MQPFRTVRSEAALEAVTPGSLVSAAYSLRTIFEKQNTNEWVEPGSEEVWTTAAVWEHMTGAYETIILDEDREVWVLIDAAAPEPVRPPRGEDSHDFLTRARFGDRNAEWVTHATLAEARAEIESLIAGRPSVGHLLIYAREDKNRIDFYTVEFFQPGTALADLPWQKRSADLPA
jgi:hypothetical protein